MHGFKGVLKIKSLTNQSTQNSFGTLDTGSRLSFPAIPKTPSYYICGTIVISYQINWLTWCKIECSTSQVHYHHFILNRILVATNNSHDDEAKEVLQLLVSHQSSCWEWSSKSSLLCISFTFHGPKVLLSRPASVFRPDKDFDISAWNLQKIQVRVIWN